MSRMSYDSQSAIVEDYAASLKELTFNSRPIIDNLTTIAKENTDVADGILSVITQRIYKCIPEQKLFSLYLLDSICKTIGNPYNILVGDEIFKLYSHVYLLVNDTVRNKMTNLFETWKLTKTKGTGFPLFPKEQLDKIEYFLAQAGYKRKQPAAAASASSTTPAPAPLKKLTNGVLIKDIDTLIPIFQNKLINNPDPELSDRFNALNQLKILLSSQAMKHNDLVAVQTKLTAIKEQELASATSPMPTSTASSAPAATSATPTTLNTATPPAIAPINPGNNGSAANLGSAFLQVPAVANHVSKANEMFNILIISGLVKVDQSLKPGSKPHYETVLPKHKFKPATLQDNGVPSNNDVETDLIRANKLMPNKSEYQQLKLNEFIKLAHNLTPTTKTSTTNDHKIDLQKFVNNNTIGQSSVQLLYECKPSRCGTCGRRFTNDEYGLSRKNMHLDWHFRINKKLANSKSNVQSRNWFLDDYDWVKFRDVDLLEYANNNGASGQNRDDGDAGHDDVGTGAVGTNTKSDSRSVPLVVIPSSETNMNNKCIICRETIKATYNDDLGEWCWYNCVAAPNDKTNRKIYHATCYNEASKKRGADEDLSSRIKREKV